MKLKKCYRASLLPKERYHIANLTLIIGIIYVLIKSKLIWTHRNANELLPEQRLHRLEDYEYTYSGQVLTTFTQYWHHVIYRNLSFYCFVTVANTSVTLRPMI